MQYTFNSSCAFMPYPYEAPGHAEAGPLRGLTFAVKDLYDVKGWPTSAGSPTVLAMSGLKEKTAPSVQKFLDAGAAMIGKTITDELAFSIAGVNHHFGTPVNGAAPERCTGGSSSGSASAVSCGLADFAVASDTGGSIRCPASQCGLVGLRPTHGRASLEGCWPLSPEFDSCGILAHDIDVFEKAAHVLYGDDTVTDESAPQLFVAKDVLELFGETPVKALHHAFAKALEVFGPAREEILSPVGYAILQEAFRTIQAKEAWEASGKVIEEHNLQLGPGIRERFAFAKAHRNDNLENHRRVQREITSHLEAMLGVNGLLMFPTMAGAAPLRTSTPADFEKQRSLAMGVFSVGGLTGLPWISLPLGTVDGAPLGLSLVAARGRDMWLIGKAKLLMRACGK